MFVCSHYELLCFVELDVREVAPDYATGKSEYITKNPSFSIHTMHGAWHGLLVKCMLLQFTVCSNVFMRVRRMWLSQWRGGNDSGSCWTNACITSLSLLIIRQKYQDTFPGL